MGTPRPITDAPAAAMAVDARIVRCACRPVDDPSGTLRRLAADLGPGPFALVVLFISDRADHAAFAGAAVEAFRGSVVIGCSTAGEIGHEGYTEGEAVAIGLPSTHFAVATCIFRDLDQTDHGSFAAQVLERRSAVAAEHPDWPNEFAFLIVDGLSLQEDELVSVLRPALGPVPLFGGSAGDGLNFGRTSVIAGGEALTGAAVLAVVRSRCPVRIFRHDHFVPTDQHMVVTRADPANRLVSEINAEPAAREYARIVGKDPNDLSPFIFAAHPVAVRFGGEHHVRSIQKVEANGDLRFFSAIDEGLVLTVAEPKDLVSHLDQALGALSVERTPDAVILCDCILRRLEVQQTQQTREVSEVLTRHGAFGFATYGEQYNSLHVNQTFTGVAIYPPDDG